MVETGEDGEGEDWLRELEEFRGAEREGEEEGEGVQQGKEERKRLID